MGSGSQAEPSGYLAVLLAAAAWGTSGVFVTFVAAEADVSALALAFWRDLTTFAVLSTTLALFRRSWLRVDRRDLGWLLGLGASLGIFHVFWNLTVMVNGVAVATVQQAAMPAIVAVAAWALWREPVTWPKIAAIALTFAGTVLVSGINAAGAVQLSPAGLILGIGTPATYASWNLFGKKVRQKYSPLTTLTYAFFFGWLVLLPLQFFTPQPFPVPAPALLWFAALISLATIAPFTAYTFALGKLPASVASILAMSEIAFVAVYA
ncbi:MAG TPA: DMT family transporter, partial [Anaerolineae bacterium]|nr:DMT family transporter [Anaerolineae bacterium]